MDIKQAKELIGSIEHRFLAELRGFEEATGLMVSGIQVHRGLQINPTQNELQSVSLEVQL